MVANLERYQIARTTEKLSLLPSFHALQRLAMEMYVSEKFSQVKTIIIYVCSSHNLLVFFSNQCSVEENLKRDTKLDSEKTVSVSLP